ncbi:hypothetical protein ABAC460_10960 [Asticcacaulis sp. AC460]|nr:hypothetical protein ABAC460_10960 [Asticcacaulis sp. AC460]
MDNPRRGSAGSKAVEFPTSELAATCIKCGPQISQISQIDGITTDLLTHTKNLLRRFARETDQPEFRVFSVAAQRPSVASVFLLQRFRTNTSTAA